MNLTQTLQLLLFKLTLTQTKQHTLHPWRHKLLLTLLLAQQCNLILMQTKLLQTQNSLQSKLT